MNAGQADRGRQRDRALVRAAAATVVSRLASSVFMVLTLAVVAHTVTTRELGVIAVLTTISAFLAFGDFGLGTLLMSRLPVARADGDAAAERQIIAVTVVTLCVTGVALGTVGASSVLFVSWTSLLGAPSGLSSSVDAAVVCLFAAGAVGIPASVGGRVLVAVQQSARAQLWLGSAAGLSFLVAVACAVLHAPLWTYVAAIAGVPAAVAAVQTGLVLREVVPGFGLRQVHAPVGLVLGYLRSGALFAIMTLSAVVSYSIDALVIAGIMGSAAAAVFAVTARLFSLVSTTLSAAGQQMWSALADAVARGDAAWVRSRYVRTLVGSVATCTVASVALVAFGRPVIRIWVGDALVPPWSLLVVLAAYTVYSTATTQACYLLAAVEEVRLIAAAGVLMTAVNLAVSIELTHHLGYPGPVLGSIVALVTVLTAPVYLLTRRQLHRVAAPAPVGRHRLVTVAAAET